MVILCWEEAWPTRSFEKARAAEAGQGRWGEGGPGNLGRRWGQTTQDMRPQQRFGFGPKRGGEHLRV